jgi:hypothetical protein
MASFGAKRRGRDVFGRLIVSLLLPGFVSMAMACGGSNTAGANAVATGQHGVNPPPRTPGTLTPQQTLDSDAKAIRYVVPNLAGTPGGPTVTVRNIQSVSYVHTTYRAAAEFIYGHPEPTVAPTPAWLFVETGDFQQRRRPVVGVSDAVGPVMHTLLVAVTQQPASPAVLYQLESRAYDISSLGPVTMIPRGQVPEIDAVRTALAPGGASIAVGAPSLAGGVVRVPVSTTGSNLTPYTGFSIHLRWDPSLFSFASASSAGSVIPGSLFCPAARVDADGAGAIYACTAIGGSPTTTAGLLATVSLTPVGTGCSALHLFTYGGADNGDAGSGTYTIDGTSAIVAMATSDGSANQAGQVC